MKNKKKITEQELLEKCTNCITGSCCKDGVEVDLEEAKKISKLNIKLKKPWFVNLQEDADMPSGWSLSTTVRHGRCVFQRKDYKCMIYEFRPTFCRDFPLEKGRLAEFYNYLCEKPPKFKLKAIKDFTYLSKV